MMHPRSWNNSSSLSLTSLYSSASTVVPTGSAACDYVSLCSVCVFNFGKLNLASHQMGGQTNLRAIKLACSLLHAATCSFLSPDSSLLTIIVTKLACQRLAKLCALSFCFSCPSSPGSKCACYRAHLPALWASSSPGNNKVSSKRGEVLASWRDDVACVASISRSISFICCPLHGCARQE